MECSFDGCEKKSATKGLCHGHYKKLLRYGDPSGGVVYSDNSGMCAAAGCDNPAKSRGLCPKHYYRFMQYGSPEKLADKKESRVVAWVRDMASYKEEKECLIWPFSRLVDGRPSMRYMGRTAIASRVMCEMAHGDPVSKEMHAAHSCGNGHAGCINPNHLRWATPSSNEMDKVEHGTSNRGERHGLSKLTTNEVLEIRAMFGSFSERATASKFSVSRRTISDIWKKKRWGWLQ